MVQSQCGTPGSYLSFIAASQGGWGSGKGATASGAPDAECGNESGAPHVGITCAAFELVVPSFYQLTGSIATVRIQTPRRRTDAWGTPRLLTFRFLTLVVSSPRWAPSRTRERKGQERTWATRPRTAKTFTKRENESNILRRHIRGMSGAKVQGRRTGSKSWLALLACLAGSEWNPRSNNSIGIFE